VKRPDTIAEVDLETPTAWTYMMPPQGMETVDPWEQIIPYLADEIC
jgi:hypothetical protein